MDQLVAMRSFVRLAQALSFQEATRLEDLSQGAISKRSELRLRRANRRHENTIEPAV